MTFSVQPTGTECIRSQQRLKLSDLIRKTISDKIARMRGTDLKAKSARAAMALGIGTCAGHGMKFVRRMILARLLAPTEIAMMAIVVTVSVAFEAITEVGVKQAVIQNKSGADTGYLTVAFWVQVVRGLGLFAVAFIAAPWISSFYDKPQLLMLLRVCFLAIVFRALVSPRAYVLEKEYRFGRAVFITQGSAVLGVVVTIVLAVAIRNVWALVLGFIAEMAMLCLLSYVLAPFLPRFGIDRQSLSELMKFARGMLGLAVLAMISMQAPVLVLAKVIPEEQFGLLGFYSYAALLAYFPIDLYSKVIGPIFLPAFSKKQDDKRALCRGLLQAARWTAISSMPLIAFMACCAYEMLFLVYSPEYAVMSVPFIILSFLILPRTQRTILTATYFAVGQPHLHRRLAIIRTVVIVVLIYPAAVHFGPLGAAAVIVLANFVLLLLQVLGCRKLIDLNLSLYLRCYIPGLLLGLPIVVIVNLLRLSGIESPFYILISGAVAFFVASMGGAYIIQGSWSER